MNSKELILDEIIEDSYAKKFCEDFIFSNKPKYIFGINYLSDSIAIRFNIDGYVDDFTEEKKYNGKPIVDINSIPQNSLVVSVVTGKAFIAKHRLEKFSFDSLDFFSFFKYFQNDISEMLFLKGAKEDLLNNFNNYKKIYSLFDDNLSKQILYKIINFRFSLDLKYMNSFKDIEEEQYFEDFLNLSKNGEIFVDIGGYDGFTSKKFIEVCPNYERIYFFEPEFKNMLLSKKNLSNCRDVEYYNFALGDEDKKVNFICDGYSSRVYQKDRELEEKKRGGEKSV